MSIASSIVLKRAVFNSVVLILLALLTIVLLRLDDSVDCSLISSRMRADLQGHTSFQYELSQELSVASLLSFISIDNGYYICSALFCLIIIIF